MHDIVAPCDMNRDRNTDILKHHMLFYASKIYNKTNVNMPFGNQEKGCMGTKKKLKPSIVKLTPFILYLFPNYLPFIVFSSKTVFPFLALWQIMLF